MARIIPQHLKSMNTIKQQPKVLSTRVMRIILLDIAGKSNDEIGEIEGCSPAHVSRIKNSPMFIQQKEVEWGKLRKQVFDKESDKITKDPVEDTLKGAALDAANAKIDLMRESENEYVKSGAASDILDRAGYKSHTEKSKISVQVTEKMANRFEEALKYEPGKHESGTTVRIEKEVSE